VHRDDAAQLRGICRRYCHPDGTVMVDALLDIDLDIPRGQYLAIMGASGSGKSTLMNILGCLDRPTAGQYLLDGEDTAQLSDEKLSLVRGKRIGFVFQAFNLIPELTVLENVEVPLFYQGIDRAARRERAQEKIELVGLTSRMSHRPAELSGGQQQRAAIARALVSNPTVIMADEPTGNLDSATGEAILGVIDRLHAQGLTIVLVTHDDRIAERSQRVIRLSDGRILSDLPGGRGSSEMHHAWSAPAAAEGGA
jgi:ABC-type lipoprotein export system ATPase subunit